MNTKAILVTLVSALSLGVAQAEEAMVFKSDKEKANYAYGLNVGGNFKQGNIEYDAAAFDRGIQDALAGKVPLSPMEQREAFMKYQQERRLQLAEKNKADGEAFLTANKAKPGVKVFPSGLQYKVLAAGSGDSPKAEDICTVKYRGTLMDGSEFDNSEKAPGGTANFPANRVIAGWTEALTNMHAGAKWQLFIPSKLAYGDAGSGAKIGPGATLLFDVELLSFTNPPPPPPPAAPPAPLTSDIIKVPSLDEMKKGAKIETIKSEDVEKLQKEKK